MIDYIKSIVADMLNMQKRTEIGTITAYNPNNYTVKVQIQPDGPETGWIPLAASWAGNGMGAVFGPVIGTDCRIDFIDGQIEASLAGARFFNSKNPPPVVQSGQGAIVDGAGSYVKLNNDGTITLGAPTGITTTTPLLKQVGNMEIDGTLLTTQNITSEADIIDQNGAHGTVGQLRSAYDEHTHGGVQTGSSNTGTPSTTL